MTLGAILTAGGCDFSVYSDIDPADGGLTLCLVDEAGTQVAERVAMQMSGNGVWRASAIAVAPNQRYGYQIHMPGDPPPGEPNDARPLLLDPTRAYSRRRPARSHVNCIRWSSRTPIRRPRVSACRSSKRSSTKRM